MTEHFADLLINTIEKMECILIQEGRCRPALPNSHPYIPFSPRRFYALIKAADKIRNKWDGKRYSFVDAGCGLGTKVYLATQFWKVDAFGIEACEPYVKIAKQM